MSTYDWVEAGCVWTPWLPFCHRSSKPAFGFDATEEIVISKAFGRLIRFSRQAAEHRPEVVVVAPMSGNHATLLREVVDTMLDCHDVSLADWTCASQVPLCEGDFGLDDNVQYIRDFLRSVPVAHVICVSQSCVSTLAAIALMAEAGESLPKSLTLIAGPIDVSAAPTWTSRLIARLSANWFAARVTEVTGRWPGVGRSVFPAYERHVNFMCNHPLNLGDVGRLEELADFYREYNSVVDLPSKYFHEIIECVFWKRSLACGTLMIGGQLARPELIEGMALLTVEGTEDKTVAPGQTAAALDLCRGIGVKERSVVDANHYTLVWGRTWRDIVAPRVMSFIRENDR